MIGQCKADLASYVQDSPTTAVDNKTKTGRFLRGMREKKYETEQKDGEEKNAKM